MAEQGRLATMASVLGKRLGIAGLLGETFGGKRDYYDEVGWPHVLTILDYQAMYERNPVAKRVVDLPANQTWNKSPEIKDDGRADGDDPTTFEQQLETLDERVRLFHHLKRVDRLARKGHFAVLLLGTGDPVEQLRQPIDVAGGKRLLYLRAYSERWVEISQCDNDPTSPRFGKPELYSIDTREGQPSVNVHHSRVIHVAEDFDEDETYGTPALKAVFNYAQMLDQTVGASGEMWWQGAFPPRVASSQEDVAMDEQTREDISDQIEELRHKLRRWLTLQNIDVETMSQQVADPQGVVSVLLDLLAGGSGVPKRLLIGSERGELASTQDKATLASLVSERMRNHAEPVIVRPTIDRLINMGVIDPPAGRGYTVEWPDPHEPSESERANTMLTKAKAARQFFGGMAETLLPTRQVIEQLGFDADEVDLSLAEDTGNEPDAAEESSAENDEATPSNGVPAATR